MQCLRKSQCPPKNTPPSAPAWKPCPTMISPSLSPPAPQPRIPPLPQTQPTQMLPPLSRTPPHHRPLCRRLCIPPLHAGTAVSPSELHPSPHNEKIRAPPARIFLLYLNRILYPSFFTTNAIKPGKNTRFPYAINYAVKPKSYQFSPPNPKDSVFQFPSNLKLKKQKSGGFNGKNR